LMRRGREDLCGRMLFCCGEVFAFGLGLGLGRGYGRSILYDLALGDGSFDARIVVFTIRFSVIPI
jgi:hypothetical protein